MISSLQRVWDAKDDIEELQRDLTQLQSWSTVNKCEIMHVLKKNDNMEPEYILRGNQLKAVRKLRILEFTSHQIYSVSLSPPTNKCANKANSMLRFMSRMVGPRKPKL